MFGISTLEYEVLDHDALPEHWRGYVAVWDNSHDANFFGVGKPGAINYYRTQTNPRFVFKANKNSISTGDSFTLYMALSDPGFCELHPCIFSAIEAVSPMKRNPFCARVVSEHPELASA